MDPGAPFIAGAPPAPLFLGCPAPTGTLHGDKGQRECAAETPTPRHHADKHPQLLRGFNMIPSQVLQLNQEYIFIFIGHRHRYAG